MAPGRPACCSSPPGSPGPGRAAGPLARLSAACYSRPWAAALTLGPLSAIHVAQFLDRRFGAGSVSMLAPTLTEMTNGHPAHIAACAEKLVADGVVARDADGYRCDVPLDVVQASIDGALRSAAHTELAALDHGDRRLLEAAACVGLEFTAESVAVAIGGNHDQARRQLDRLSSCGQIIARTPAAGAAKGGAYRFQEAISAELFAESAPMFQQIHVSERLAVLRDPRLRRA